MAITPSILDHAFAGCAECRAMVKHAHGIGGPGKVRLHDAAPCRWRVVPHRVHDDPDSYRDTWGVQNATGTEWIATDVRERDAAVIAAAPEMRDALDAVMRDKRFVTMGPEAVEAVRAALCAAEGLRW